MKTFVVPDSLNDEINRRLDAAIAKYPGVALERRELYARPCGDCGELAFLPDFDLVLKESPQKGFSQRGMMLRQALKKCLFDRETALKNLVDARETNIGRIEIICWCWTWFLSLQPPVGCLAAIA
jgi:hypothetical protein